jgi:23S rRNA pseudouridine1911/1915/1917 synthase
MSARVKIGRQAITEYETEERFGVISLLRVRILTGRTHQIRVHLSHRGWPIVGDSEYGRRSTAHLGLSVGRQMLHSERLSVDHPITRKRVEFVAPVPEDMRLLIESLKSRKDTDR